MPSRKKSRPWPLPQISPAAACGGEFARECFRLPTATTAESNRGRGRSHTLHARAVGASLLADAPGSLPLPQLKAIAAKAAPTRFTRSLWERARSRMLLPPYRCQSRKQSRPWPLPHVAPAACGSGHGRECFSLKTMPWRSATSIRAASRARNLRSVRAHSRTAPPPPAAWRGGFRIAIPGSAPTRAARGRHRTAHLRTPHAP